MDYQMEDILEMTGQGKHLVDLGYANGWEMNGGTPLIVKWCRAEGHKLQGREAGRCLTEHWCSICGYTYKIDSSD